MVAREDVRNAGAERPHATLQPALLLWGGEGKSSNEVRLWLSLIAYNLGNLCLSISLFFLAFF
jgi:hypothetical protein